MFESNRAARMVKVGAMALKAVVPSIPKSTKDRELLEEDLRRIGCHGLMKKPWGLRMEDLEVELLGEKDIWWHGTMRQAPEKWTVKEWRKVYGFAREREGMASQTDQFIEGKFSGQVNPKDGYAVVDCKEPRARNVLEFLVSLLYPEKPTRVTITVGNTIFGALSGERLVDWGVVVKDLVQRLLSGMGRSKATPICPYVFHLYHSHELLLSAEKKEYRIKEALLKHNVKSEGEEDPKSPEDPGEEESLDDSECESLTSGEIREIQKQDATRLKKSPLNKQKQPPAKELVANKWKNPSPLEGPDWSYQVIAHALKDIRERERERKGLIRALCRKRGNVQPDGLLEAIDDLPSQKKVDELEAKNAFLLEKANKTGAELKEEKEEHKKALDKLNVALAFNQELEAYVGNTGDVINKAKLFDANLAKNPVTAEKVIPVLVDFAEKMEELLDEMRVLFNELQLKVPPIAVENLPDILGEIPSLTGWGKEATTETPTKPDQPGASEPTREEEVPAGPEPLHSPKTRTVGTSPAPREVSVNTVVDEVVRELEEEERQAFETSTSAPPARIDTIQTGPEEPTMERMRELPTPPFGPTPKPILVATPRPLVRPSFLSQLEKISKTPFKTPGPGQHSDFGINSNSREHRHGYTGQTGSNR